MKHFLLIFIVLPLLSLGQEIDYRYHLNYQRKQEVFLNFENDFFLATDRYYSQGLSLAYKRPVLNTESFINKLYLGKGEHSIGFGFDQMGFTPTSIAYDTVLSSDRPFAGTLRLNTVLETIDSARNSAVSWTLSVGIIGPEAGLEQTQTGVHRATSNPLPLGWHNQINTGLLLDLNLYAQKQLLAFGSWFILVGEGSAWVGTSRINGTLGARMQFQYLTKNRKFAFGTYANPAVTAAAYDGTLQGSLIGKRSVYTIGPDHLKNAIFEREFGAFFRLKNFEMTGTVNIFTNTFHGGNLQRWGGLRAKVYF